MDNTVITISLGMVKAFLLKGDDSAILVDSGNPGQAARILEAMAEHGIAPEDIRLILITHGHTDHFGSAKALCERTGAPVAIHAKDAAALRGESDDADTLKPTGKLLGMLMRLGIRLPDAPPEAFLEPDLVFEEAWRLDAYGVAGEVIPTPGHTPGSVSVLLDSGEAIVGDIVMGKWMGIFRQPGAPIVAWDLERNFASLRAFLQEHKPHTIHTAHGGPFTLADLIQL
jgi:hydroxyacylglutathione hydrolase